MLQNLNGKKKGPDDRAGSSPADMQDTADGSDLDNDSSERKIEKLRILSIGNSFNQDSMAYLPPLLEELFPDTEVSIGILYAGGAKIQEHITWWNEDKPYIVFNYWPSGSRAWKRISSGKKSLKKNATLKRVLAMEECDLITIQGVTSDVMDEKSTDVMIKDLTELSELLRENAPKPFSLVWFQWMPRPYESMSLSEVYEHINQATARVIEESGTGIQDYFPIGTAFQSARTYPSLQTIGTSENQNLLFSDNLHMQAGLPSLLAAYTISAKILQWCGRDPSELYSTSWVPDAEIVKAINASDGSGGGMTHGEPEGLTEDSIALAKQIAVETVLNMDSSLEIC